MAYRAVIKPESAGEVRERNRKVPEDAGNYLRARGILADLRSKRLNGRISFEDYKALKAMAVAGDIDGATKGLAAILARQ